MSKELSKVLKRHQFMNERMDAHQKLLRWKRDGRISVDDTANHLAKLVGFRGYSQMAGVGTEETRRKLKLLSGPHGWTVYKLLLARMNP